MGKKWSKMTKKFCLLCSISQESYIKWYSFVLHNCKMIVSMSVFHFSKFWFFWVVRRVKKQKIVQNDQNLSTVPYISGTTHHMILIFGTHKRIISPGFFSHFFQILIVGVNSGKRAKNDPWLPISSCPTLYLKNCRSYRQDFCYTGVK